MLVADPAQQPEGTIVPVIDYAFFWLVLGLLILAAIVAYFLLTVYLTRPRPPRESMELPPARPPVRALKREYLGRVDELEARFIGGEVDARRAHAELSLLVRAFVAAVSTVPADRMTLAELGASGLRPVTSAVGQYYPLVFGADDPQGLAAGADAARAVIGSWR